MKVHAGMTWNKWFKKNLSHSHHLLFNEEGKLSLQINISALSVHQGFVMLGEVTDARFSCIPLFFHPTVCFEDVMVLKCFILTWAVEQYEL